MNPTTPTKTYLDYRSGLRKVNPQEPHPSTVRMPSQQSIQSIGDLSRPSTSSRYSEAPVPPPRSPRRVTPPGSSHTTTSPRNEYTGLHGQQPPPQYSSALQPPQSPAAFTLPERPAPTMTIKNSKTVAIIVSETIPSNIQPHLLSILGTHQAEEVILIGPQEAILKQIKMECYTVAGKLSKGISVQMVPTQGRLNMETLLQTLKGTPTTTLLGVLLSLSPKRGHGMSDSQQDVLDIEEEDLESSWQSSVHTVHSLARQTIPLMPRPSNGQAFDSPMMGTTAETRPFFVIDNELSFHLPHVVRLAQESLLQEVARSMSAMGVDVGYASDFLHPPKAKEPIQTKPIDIARPVATNGYSNGGITPGTQESPTKLWNLWAMQNE